MQAEATIIRELEEQRPATSPGLLSRQEKDRLIERGSVALYRWYLARSQATRNWNPDSSFNWRAFRTNHSPALIHILEGFFAVEQYVPDYVRRVLDFIRKNYGRSQFHVRWGAEEGRHEDTWYNTLLFSRARSADWLEEYKNQLRGTEWQLPWEDPLHMLFYTLVQERATQLSYLHTALIATGRSRSPELANDADPILNQVCRTIAHDEAAHYNFFNELSRLMFYYYPAKSLEVLVDVIQHFVMPARDIIPNYPRFEEIAIRAGILGTQEYMREVLPVVLKNLDLRGNKALAIGIRRSRQVPDPDGNLRDTALFEAIDYNALQDTIKRLYGRFQDYEETVGLADVALTQFTPSGLASNA